MSKPARAGYPSDVRDEEWEFVLPYLLLWREDAAQRQHDLRLVFNGVRYAACTGGSGVIFPTSTVRGGRCTSRCGAGSRPVCSKCW